jgi:hypothetical protein
VKLKFGESADTAVSSAQMLGHLRSQLLTASVRHPPRNRPRPLLLQMVQFQKPLTSSKFLSCYSLGLELLSGCRGFSAMSGLHLEYHASRWRAERSSEISEISKKTKLHGLSPRANYTDRATDACRRSDCQLFADRGCHVVSVTDPYGSILCFLDRSRYFSIK